MSTEYSGYYDRHFPIEGGPGVPREESTASERGILDVGAIRVNADPNARLHSGLLQSLTDKAARQVPVAELEPDFRALAVFEAIAVGHNASRLGRVGLSEIEGNLDRFLEREVTDVPYSVHDRLTGHWDVTMAAQVDPLAEVSAEQQLINALALPDAEINSDVGVGVARAVALKVGDYYTSPLLPGETDEAYERMCAALGQAIADRPEEHVLTQRLRGIHDVLGAAVLIGREGPITR
ncbi:MAG TPA: hypothetical protein VLA92_01265 [Candidatus Saccharimonadales bacterium]|nr:hypothetical protein [Candidatus Saccharimonadales bacterium]